MKAILTVIGLGLLLVGCAYGYDAPGPGYYGPGYGQGYYAPGYYGYAAPGYRYEERAPRSAEPNGAFGG